MQLPNLLDPLREIKDGFFMPSKRQVDLPSPFLHFCQRTQVMIQTGGQRQSLWRLVRAGTGQHVVTAKQYIVQANDDMPGTMTWGVEHFKRTQFHTNRLK